MSKQVRAIFFILTLIVIPFLIYAFLQVRSLDEDERMASIVYQKQMETMLFSLNQYADDMMGQWIRRLSDEQQPIYQNASNLVLGNESIQLLVLRDIQSMHDSLYFNDYVDKTTSIRTQVKNWYHEKDSVLSRLTDYLGAGFRKIQAVDDWADIEGLRPDQTGMTIMLYDQDSILYNALLILESNFWVEQVLGAKMQEIDHQDFRLAVLHWPKEQEQPTFIYSTEGFSLDKSFVRKPLWVLSDTYLSIQAKGESYSDLVKARSQKNLYFLLFSVAMVLIGAVLIIRNIRSALKIAQLKSDFVSNVSHEIRTPLSLIRMYSETLMLGRLSSEEKKEHYYQIIHHESGRLTYLVNNILDFSRIEADRKTYHLEEKNLNELMQSLFTNFSYYFKENDVNCELTVSEHALKASVDSQAVEEALSNLIENAIKYSHETKFIHISTYEEEGFVCCEVSDKGSGISKADQKHIFDKFYRVEGAMTQKTKGTGLGLSLVKHIMESHGGQITVSSSVGHGSTFILHFPVIVN